MEKDHYEILGVPPSAGEDAIRAAYRLQMTLYHPDKVAALGTDLQRVAEERTKDINAAYAVLGNALSRAAYDRRSEPFEPEPRPPSPPPPARDTVRPTRSNRPVSKKPTGPIHRGAQVASIGFSVCLPAAIIAAHMPGMSHPALSTLFGVIINVSLIVTYVGLYMMVRAVITAMRAFGSRHLVARTSEHVVRSILTIVSAILCLVSLTMVVAIGKEDASRAFFYWVLLGSLAFAGFTLLLLATSLAPRWVNRHLLQLSGLITR